MAEHLIELVRGEPCLYDTNHPDYSKNTLKELLWVKIAKKLNYKDGASAKEAWLKLRNCHRDATRRRNKLYKSGTVIKPWKYESQMEFLLSYMVKRPTSGNIATGSCDESLLQLEECLHYTENEFAHNEVLRKEASLELLPSNVMSNGSNEHSSVSFQSLPPDDTDFSSTEDSAASSRLLTTHISKKDTPCTVKQSTKRKKDRAKERAEQKANCAEVDELQHFFNTMYAMTKKMPALSQHKLKRQIFNIVSDEEEYLLHLGQTSTNIISTSATPTPPPGTSVLASETYIAKREPL